VCSPENALYDAANDVVLLDIQIDAQDISSFSMTNTTVLPTLTVDEVKERFTRKTSLQDKKKYLLGSEFRADVWFSFVNSTNVIPAHRLIIEEHSPVLGEIINKSTDGQVLIDSHSAEIFMILLRFMYRHELVEEIHLKKWISIISAASIFRMSCMLQAISMYLCQGGMDLKDTFALLDAAIVADAKELKDALLTLIDEKATSFLGLPEFLILSRDTVREIIRRDTLNVMNEQFVFISVCKWALKQCEKRGLQQNSSNLRKEMQRAGLLRLIRFSSLAITEFNQLKTTIKNEFNIDLSIHQGCSLLSPEESLSIVNYIIDESSRSLGCIFPSQRRLCLRFLAFQIFRILRQNMRQNTAATPVKQISTPAIAPARNVQPSTSHLTYTPQIPQRQQQPVFSILLSQTQVQVPQGQSQHPLPSSANKQQRYSQSSEQNLLSTVSTNSLPNVAFSTPSRVSNVASQTYHFSSQNAYSGVQQQQMNMTYIQNPTLRPSYHRSNSTPVSSTPLIVQQLQQVPQQFEQYQNNSATPPCISIPDNSPPYNAASNKNV